MCFIKIHAIKVCGNQEAQLHKFIKVANRDVFPRAGPFIPGKTSPVPIGHVAGWNALEKRKMPCSWFESKPIFTNINLVAGLLLLLFLLYYPTILFGQITLFYLFLPRVTKLRTKEFKYYFTRIVELSISKKNAGIQTIINSILKCTS